MDMLNMEVKWNRQGKIFDRYCGLCSNAKLNVDIMYYVGDQLKPGPF